MTTSTINHRPHHRPATYLAAAAAVAAIAAGSAALSFSLHDNASGPQPATTIAHQHVHQFPNTINGLPPTTKSSPPPGGRVSHGTTSGGRVMVGE